MNNFKHILLCEKGVRAFKEERPADEAEILKWEQSGIDIDFFSNEREKLLNAKTYLKFMVKGQYLDITDFCEIRKFTSIDEKFNVLYAFYKPPAEEQKDLKLSLFGNYLLLQNIKLTSSNDVEHAIVNFLNSEYYKNGKLHSDKEVSELQDKIINYQQRCVLFEKQLNEVREENNSLNKIINIQSEQLIKLQNIIDFPTKTQTQ